MGEVAQVEQGEDEDKSRDRFTQEVENRVVDGWASREDPHAVAFVSLSRLEVRVVVQDYQSCPDKGAQELPQQVRHYLTPWEEAEGRETNSYRWVEVALCAELASHVNAEGYRHSPGQGDKQPALPLGISLIQADPGPAADTQHDLNHRS